MLQHEHIHVIVQCTCTLYLHTDHLTMQCAVYRHMWPHMWAHMHTHKHILCTHIHTHDPLPCHKAHQNTSLQRLPSARSCGYPILHSGTVPRWSLYQGSWHRPARWADWSYQLQSRHWKRQLRSQRCPADGISPGHPLQSRSHHTPSPRCCCSTPPPSQGSRGEVPPTSLTCTLITGVAVSGRRKKGQGEVKRKGKRLKKCGDEVHRQYCPDTSTRSHPIRHMVP